MKKLLHEWAPSVVTVCVLEVIRILAGPAAAFMLAVLGLFTLVAFLFGVGTGLERAETKQGREP